MNSVCVIGRITKDLELKETSKNSVCNFSIAVNKKWNGNDEVSYFDVVVWGKLASLLNQYCGKGSQIAVDGYLQQQRWESDGKKNSKVVIVANNIQFLDPKKEKLEYAKEEEIPF